MTSVFFTFCYENTGCDLFLFSSSMLPHICVECYNHKNAMFLIYCYPYFFDNPCNDFNFRTFWAAKNNLINDNHKPKQEPGWKCWSNCSLYIPLDERNFQGNIFLSIQLQIYNLQIMKKNPCSLSLSLALSLSLINIYKRNVYIQVFVFKETLMHVNLFICIKCTTFIALYVSYRFIFLCILMSAEIQSCKRVSLKKESHFEILNTCLNTLLHENPNVDIIWSYNQKIRN